MIKKGLAVAVILLFVGVAFTNVVGYQVIKSSNQQYFTKELDITIDDKPSINTGLWNFPVTCIVLFYLFTFFSFLYLAGVQIAKDIGNAIGQRAYEMNCWWARDNRLIPSPDEDCGCNDEESELEWGYPALCTFLYPLWILSVALLMLFNTKQFVDIMDAIGLALNCFWAQPGY